ncbi:Septation protein imp2 [Meyerozyma sp. JA9]|nr:Septation protein imp2 [Meyerozyma sp. JA9]
MLDRPFVNCFWGDSNNGFSVVRTRIHDGLRTLQELLDYYHDRISVEKEYVKRLERLNSKIPLGSHETGTLKKALDSLAAENRHMAQYSDKFARSVAQQSYDRLSNFTSMYTKKVLKIEHHMAKLATKRSDAFKQVEASRTKYQEECAQIKSLRLLVQTTWGKELEKNEAKLRKLSSSTTSQKNYESALVKYRELDEIYVRDWSLALQDIYQLEIERIQTCKINCFGFCNHVATLCVDNDQAVDIARSAFAVVAPPTDLDDFARNYGTGDKIYSAPKYVDYMNGYGDDEPTFKLAEFDTPDCKDVMRTVSKKEHRSPTKATKELPQSPQQRPETRPLRVSPQSSPQSVSNIADIPTVQPQQNLSPKSPQHNRNGGSVNSAYGSGHEDVFSHKEEKFAGSNGSSNYSNLTSYSSTSSNSERHWASPRRKEKQLSQYQDQINRQSQELPPAPRRSEPETKPVPLTKDFSIDFIAKALEDLNAGGDGDVSRFRRSLRGSSANDATTAPTTPFLTREEEPAVRRESIAFRTPGPRRSRADLDGSPVKPRPKSMIDTTNDSLATCIVRQASDDTLTATPGASPARRSLSRTPSRKVKNLHSIIAQVTPHSRQPYVSKARARYSYKSQQHGELSFKKGWLMYVIHKQEDNWFVCELTGTDTADGSVGLVPGNYVTEGDYF